MGVSGHALAPDAGAVPAGRRRPLRRRGRHARLPENVRSLGRAGRLARPPADSPAREPGEPAGAVDPGIRGPARHVPGRLDPFRAALAAAHAAGSHAMVYMNQRLWCTGTSSWTTEDAARWAVKERDGRIREEVYNVFDPQPCATMDVTTPFWRAKYARIADTV